jgi:hypothetical protein
MNPAAVARQDKAVCPWAVAARVCGFAMSLLAVKLQKKIKAAKVKKIKVKRQIPTRALPLFFECNMERPFVASDILRTFAQKTPIAKNYVLSRPIPLKNRFLVRST